MTTSSSCKRVSITDPRSATLVEHPAGDRSRYPSARISCHRIHPREAKVNEQPLGRNSCRPRPRPRPLPQCARARRSAEFAGRLLFAEYCVEMHRNPSSWGVISRPRNCKTNQERSVWSASLRQTCEFSQRFWRDETGLCLPVVSRVQVPLRSLANLDLLGRWSCQLPFSKPESEKILDRGFARCRREHFER